MRFNFVADKKETEKNFFEVFKKLTNENK